jgi:hypothetical protein
MSLIDKAKQWYTKYKVAKEYVDAINALPPNYTLGGQLQIKQYVSDPVSEPQIKRALERAQKAEDAWKAYCAKNNC